MNIIAEHLPTFEKNRILTSSNFPWKEPIADLFGFEPEFFGFNPWRGCIHDCSYCWVKGLNERFGNIKPDGDFLNIELCSNTQKLLKQEVPRLPENAVIIASTTTDCFQRKVFSRSEFLVQVKHWFQELKEVPVLTISKNAKMALYLPYFNREKHVIGFSLTGLSHKDKRKDDFEPGSSYHESRVFALYRAQKFGFKTFASIEPYFISPTKIVKELLRKGLRPHIAIGTCNYSLKDLWTRKQYLQFYRETMGLKEEYDLKLWWKPDALRKIRKWQEKEPAIVQKTLVEG